MAREDTGEWTSYVSYPTNSDLYAMQINTQNLNDIIAIGTYVQTVNVNASSDLNYPINEAGFLEVMARTNTDWILQRYTGWQSADATYKRVYYHGTWQNWVKA